MAPADWPSVCSIYEEGIASGNATFETKPPTWKQWDRAHLASCRLVAVDQDGVVLGWAAMSAVSARAVYRGVCEESVYVAESARGKGVGRLLLERLIADSEAEGRWTLQAGIFPENKASIALHESCGFRILGKHERIANHFGTWRDTLLLERRSKVVGV
jgi:phosphinothricin acetyltransferase